MFYSGFFAMVHFLEFLVYKRCNVYVLIVTYETEISKTRVRLDAIGVTNTKAIWNLSYEYLDDYIVQFYMTTIDDYARTFIRYVFFMFITHFFRGFCYHISIPKYVFQSPQCAYK